MLQAVKRALRRAGYDIVRYHPSFDRMLEKYDIDTIIDIGANTGQFALDMHARLPQAAIYSFEPLPDAFLALVANLKQIPNSHAFNVALGETDETTTIFRSSFTPSSSFLPMTGLLKKSYPKIAQTTEETVRVRRLDDMQEELSLGRNLLVKLDVQGYEDKVLRGGAEVIARAKMLMMEVSFVALYEQQPLFGDIYRIVSDMGFVYAGSRERHYDPKTEALLYEDALFAKRN